MELLDRYLQAVKRHLPWQRQDDIIAELRANLEAQLEDKEAELGRPITKAEAEEWLKQMGSPIQVAARYQRQQYLIGPTLFPTYSYVLRLVLAWATAIYLIARVVTIAAQGLGAGAYVGMALSLPWIWLINAAVTTLIFAVIELMGAHFPEKFRAFGPMAGSMAGPMTAPWSPMDLPPAGAGDGDWAKPRSFMKALLQVFSGCLFLAYILLVPHYPFLLFGPGAWYFQASPYALAPVWWTFYWCLVALNAFELAWKIVDLARGAWQRPRNRARHLALHALSLIPICVLLAAPNHVLFLLKNPADAAAHDAALASANKGVFQALTILVAILVLQLVWGIVRASLEAYRKRVAAAQ
ncbi:MAG: hypothetical protein WCF30_08365 [Terracidiphilus sp.]